MMEGALSMSGTTVDCWRLGEAADGQMVVELSRVELSCAGGLASQGDKDGGEVR